MSLYTSKPTILIVDDQPNNLKLIASILSSNYDLLIANSGTKALQILEKKHPDLILLDVMMPDITGHEVCKIIKNNKDLQDIPIIFLTAKVEAEDVIKGLNLGAVDYITKPFNQTEMTMRVKNHINLYLANIEIEKQKNELQQNQDIILDQNKKLIESNNTKDRLFSIIAHDLKNPIQGLMLNSETLINYSAMLSDEEKSKQYGKILDSVKGLNDFLENLMEWSKSQRGILEFNPQNYNLRDSIENLVSLFQKLAAQKSVSILNRIDTDLIANCDIKMINTVFKNIISNAIKYSNENGNILIESSFSDVDKFQITFSDNGIGIDPKSIESIFDIGNHIKTPGTYNEEGTGLGLILSKEFLDKNDAEINIESEIGNGTKVTLIFNKVKE